jgi:hypothetical protein
MTNSMNRHSFIKYIYNEEKKTGLFVCEEALVCWGVFLVCFALKKAIMCQGNSLVVFIVLSDDLMFSGVRKFVLLSPEHCRKLKRVEELVFFSSLYMYFMKL